VGDSNHDRDSKGHDKHGKNSAHGGGCGSVLKKLFLLIIALSAGIAIYINVVPDDHYPAPITLADPPSIEVNNHLSSAEKLYEGLVHAPEQIVHHNGDIYTGTSDGRIIKISNGLISTVARLGYPPPCGDEGNKRKCSFPLGMRFDHSGQLIVCDPYQGLHKINVATGEVQVLLPSSTLINGRPLNFLNNLDIAKDGIMYLSDSTVYTMHTFFMDLYDGRPTGRLFRYDPVRNSTKLLIDNLGFANGVQLSKKEDFVIVSEFYRARIMKYNLKGKNAGKAEVFADNLPLLPDNIRLSSSGGFWTGCGFTRYKQKMFNVIDFLAARPWLRKICIWLIELVKPSVQFMMGVGSSGSMVVELNEKGEIVQMLMDKTGHHVVMTSAVEDVDGVLYIGSYGAPYIAMLDTNKL